MNNKLFSLISVLLFFYPLLHANDANSAVIPAERVMVINKIAEDQPIRPYQSAFPEVIRFNLVQQVEQAIASNQPLRFDSKPKTWLPLNKMRSLTEPGIQILKMELSTEQFTMGKLTLKGFDQATVYQNGQWIKMTDSVTQLTLTTGEHRILIVAEQVNDWRKVSLDWKNNDGFDNNVSFNEGIPPQRLSAEQLFDSEEVLKVRLSPDGKHIIWTKQHYSPATEDNAIVVTELIDAKTQQVLYRWQALTPGSIGFSPDNRFISYSVANNLYILDRKTLALSTIAQGLIGASQFLWYDDNQLIFSWSQQDNSGNEITKRYRAIEDRWQGWRNNEQIFMINRQNGLIKQLTENKLSYHLLDFDQKKQKLLVSRDRVDYKKPPHILIEVLEMDLTNYQQKVIGHYRSLITAAYAPNGIYILAGPEFADRIGATVAENSAINNYDGQLYLTDRKGHTQPLSKDFTPSINHFSVLQSGNLLLSVIDQDRHQLVHYQASNQQYLSLDTQLDDISSYSVSKTKQPVIAYAGTTATHPQQVHISDLNNQRKVLFDSKKTNYSQSLFSRIHEWDFTTTEGHTVDGRYYLPPNFDKNKSYPMITYYYGGTTPISRAFTGRWPYSLWAAQGYVVYVLQPSGTVGYGQAYSAKHVNAWGKHTADDIIQSTQAFLQAHPFVDKNRVGNMGASYGGFMTMYLATKTNMFKASISHAGISNLAEYWGYGWWGYNYSGVASEGSFPWNNRPLYIDQSPLYSADKITTPLLLLHGDSDTNVPVSESHQMYTALKMLDKDVEFIEFANDDHHINSRSHRLLWWSTILAYFDKHLKNEPQWWQTLYPEN